MRKITTLPTDPEEIITRLKQVNDADEAMQLYGIIARDAGRELVALGVVMMFVLAIADTTKGYPPFLKSLMYTDIPAWIDALIDDQEVATEAKELLAEVLNETKASRQQAPKPATRRPPTPEEERRFSELARTQSGFNPGALRVSMDLYDIFGDTALSKLEEFKIHGEDIWVLYSRVCNENYARMIELLLNGTAVDELKKNRFSSFYRQT